MSKINFVLEEWFLNISVSECDLGNCHLQNSQSHSENSGVLILGWGPRIYITLLGEFGELDQKAFFLPLEVFLEEKILPTMDFSKRWRNGTNILTAVGGESSIVVKEDLQLVAKD